MLASAISRTAQHARSPCPQGFGLVSTPLSFRTGPAGSLDRIAVLKNDDDDDGEDEDEDGDEDDDVDE